MMRCSIRSRASKFGGKESNRASVCGGSQKEKVLREGRESKRASVCGGSQKELESGYWH